MTPATERSKELLVQTLAFLKALHWAHWTSHWQTSGTTFYADHELFSRLYTGVVDEIDGLAEKIVAFHGPNAVDPLQIEPLATRALRKFYGKTMSIPDRALMMEEKLQSVLKELYDSIKEQGDMSLGLDDFIMALANTHETNVYLLKQRASIIPPESTLRAKVIKLAHAHPELRKDLLPILKSASGQYMLVKDLPEGLQSALHEVGYGKRDIKVEPASMYSPAGVSGEGTKSFTAVVDLGTGRYKISWGSWGGANINAPHNQVDLDTKTYPIPPNGAVISGTTGGNHPAWAFIQVNPDNLQKLLPAGTDVDLTDPEKIALKIIKTYRAGARADGFSRSELGPYKPDNPIIQKLLGLGLVKLTGAGLQITLSGKNLADSFKGIYV